MFLPPEIVEIIFDNMRGGDMKHAMCVNSTWHDAFYGSDNFWSDIHIDHPAPEATEDIIKTLAKVRVRAECLTVDGPEDLLIRVLQAYQTYDTLVTNCNVDTLVHVARDVKCVMLSLSLHGIEPPEVFKMEPFARFEQLREVDVFIHEGIVLDARPLPRTVEHVRVGGMYRGFQFRTDNFIKSLCIDNQHFNVELDLSLFPHLESMEVSAPCSVLQGAAPKAQDVYVAGLSGSIGGSLSEAFPKAGRLWLSCHSFPEGPLPPALSHLTINLTRAFSSEELDWSYVKGLTQVCLRGMRLGRLKLPPSIEEVELRRSYITELSLPYASTPFQVGWKAAYTIDHHTKQVHAYDAVDLNQMYIAIEDGLELTPGP
jgi:hypothetical protein